MRAAAASCSAAPPAGRRSPARACSTRTATATRSRCTVPTCRAYDPAYAYELGVDHPGRHQADVRRSARTRFYYITVMNEQYEMPAMPEGARDGIIKGLYRFQAAPDGKAKAQAQLIGSGAILNEVVKAQALLEKYGVGGRRLERDELQRALSRRASRRALEPAQPDARRRACRTSPSASARPPGVVVAASDYLKSQPDMISRWVGRPMVTLGTDGFGRSEDRASLRNFFEVDARHVAAATLSALAPRRTDRREGRRAGVQGSRDRPRTRRIRRLRRRRRGAAGTRRCGRSWAWPDPDESMADLKSNCPSLARTSRRATSSACS